MTKKEKNFKNYEVSNLSGDLEKTALQFTREYDKNGNRVCNCGSGIVWARCPGNNGETRYCG